MPFWIAKSKKSPALAFASVSSVFKGQSTPCPQLIAERGILCRARRSSGLDYRRCLAILLLGAIAPGGELSRYREEARASTPTHPIFSVFPTLWVGLTCERWETLSGEVALLPQALRLATDSSLAPDVRYTHLAKVLSLGMCNAHPNLARSSAARARIELRCDSPVSFQQSRAPVG